VIVELIATTQTSSALRVCAELDLGRYLLAPRSANYTVPPAAAQPHQQSN
jgi:hypothetical protein